eukprot:8168877-Alexandrium_andersonii.AAC.1
MEPCPSSRLVVHRRRLCGHGFRKHSGGQMGVDAELLPDRGQLRQPNLESRSAPLGLTSVPSVTEKEGW